MRKYDVYWYQYKYLKSDAVPKKRPIIFLGNGKALPIGMEITKHPPRVEDDSHWDYPIEYWREAGLKVPSTALVAEINYIDTELPKSDYIGHLSDFDIENIKIMLRTIPEETKSPVHKDNEKEIEEMYRRALKEIGRLL